MCWELSSHLIEENYQPAWKCSWTLIEKNSSFLNRTILTFLIFHSDQILLGDILQKSIFFRDQSIINVSLKIY